MNNGVISEHYFQRANVRAASGKYEQAIADYDRALELKPRQAAAYYNNRGNAKDACGRHEEAMADYDEAIRIDPQHASAYVNRGTAYRSTGMHDRAIADYNEAIRLNPDDTEHRRLEKAVHDLARTTPQEPGKRSILELRGSGKEVWEDVDAQEFVDGLRKEWDPKR